jgi:hypothetical protein
MGGMRERLGQSLRSRNKFRRYAGGCTVFKNGAVRRDLVRPIKMHQRPLSRQPGFDRLSSIDGPDKKLESQFLSMPLHVDYLHAIGYALPMRLLFAVLIRDDKYVHFWRRRQN